MLRYCRCMHADNVALAVRLLQCEYHALCLSDAHRCLCMSPSYNSWFCSALSWTQLSPQLDEQHFAFCAHCRLTINRHSGEKETRLCGKLSAVEGRTLACAQELQLVSCTC